MKNKSLLLFSVLLISFSIIASACFTYQQDIKNYYAELKQKKEIERKKKEEEDRLKEQIDNTTQLVASITEKLTTNLVDDKFPENVNVEFVDSWDKEFKVKIISDSKIEIRSSGPDQKFDTDDDIFQVGIKEESKGVKYYLKSVFGK